MSDETTARDRAIKDMTVALTPYLGDRIFGLPQTPDAVLAAVWPLVERYAQDEVLRALAAAPAGDDELREAGLSALRLVVRSKGAAAINAEHARAVLAEYDERGRERDAARAEVEVLGRHADRLGRQIDKHLAELQRLRARDEAAKALARWWNGLGGCSQAVLRDPRRGFRAGADALDALARAHETGGQDR